MTDETSIAGRDEDAVGRDAADRASITRRHDAAARDVEPSTDAEAVIPIVEETARIDKRFVEKGRVRVSTHTETIEEVLHERLRSEAVGVTRVPVDRVVAEGETAPTVRTEDGVTIVPVLEEVLVVEKRLVLKEEVHIRHTRSGEDVEVPVTLRRQRAVIERVSPEGRAEEQSAEPGEQETNP